ncbi:hypothetical protein [Pyrodictium abyssi]|uniref:hypothetical protein n=1 Tax=Pyrodictium abyssi TaxID=54256 RepID=UPI0030C76F22
MAAAFVSIYFLYRGFSALRRYDEGYRVGVYGAVAALLGVLSLVAGVAVSLAVLASGSLDLVPLAAVFYVVGVLLGVVAAAMLLWALWRLGGEPGGALVRVGVVLWLVAIVLAVGAVAAGGGAAGFYVYSLVSVLYSSAIALGARSIRGQARRRAGSPSPGGVYGYWGGLGTE